jgi:hypothetical protein
VADGVSRAERVQTAKQDGELSAGCGVGAHARIPWTEQGLIHEEARGDRNSQSKSAVHPIDSFSWSKDLLERAAAEETEEAIAESAQSQRHRAVPHEPC